MVDTPDLSVIIPTTGQRNQLLQRAIASALDEHGPLRVEVLVVKNGFDGMIPLNDPRARLLEAPRRNVCVARNAGLLQARGKYVRFLDDDDFLFPQVSLKQYREAVAGEFDVSSFAIQAEDELGKVSAIYRPPARADFCAAQLGPARMQLTHAHLYRREVIESLRWNEVLRVSEDIAWLQSIAASVPQARWSVGEDIVGVWYQHRSPRASLARAAHEPHFNTAESIINAVGDLKRTGQLNPERAEAAALGLWECVHKAFYRRPLYWHRVARIAQQLLPDSRPSDPFFRTVIGARIDPLLVEWAMIPKRWGNEATRGVRRPPETDHVRTL